MTIQLAALSIDAHDPPQLARFWAGVLDRELAYDPEEGFVLLPSDDTDFKLRFLPAHELGEKPLQNQMHFDLTSTSLEDQQRTVARALELGGRHYDVGQGPEVTHVVLADPEDNEFCVIAPGNKFLAGTGVIGALAGDGTQEVGYFWSRALDWPLVWDQDEETAIQSPRGGSKLTWGGPPVRPKTGRNRLHFDLAPLTDGDQQAEVDRLVALGAVRVGVDRGAAGQVEMLDPDGNEFWVWPAR